MNKYLEYKQLNLPQISKDILKFWQENKTFEKSITTREGKTPWVFYEGPPSANGLPGIHHVMARALKDIFCRFKTLQGYQVKRKAGWDTHGLPIELGVEKSLGITKEDIGNKNSPKYISVEDYNKACRKEVMKYTDKWEEVTSQMGYWVDMSDPYITYDNKYIESVWWLLQKLFYKKDKDGKNLLYKGYTIQPYSPAAGTGLSSHELNQPGCYRDVKDRTAVAMFKVIDVNTLNIPDFSGEVFFLAWTTTPWTLPSNTALAVGRDIDYVAVKTFHPHSKQKKEIVVILAKNLVHKYFSEKHTDLKFEDYKLGDKNIPFKIVAHYKGNNLGNTRYKQLLPFIKIPEETGFRVVCDNNDFVTTEDGTGIVHIAPNFGAEDYKIASQNAISPGKVEVIVDGTKRIVPLVDERGRFLAQVDDGEFLFGNEYVKEAYLSDEEKKSEIEKFKSLPEENLVKKIVTRTNEYLSVDERIVLKLENEERLFKKETYVHSYPHCWRTDKPVLYYPLTSWFIRSTSMKDRMIQLNKTINWKPESTGTGRFGNWLENLNDWNLSRSRFWGIPIPIWTDIITQDKICIGKISELKNSISSDGKNCSAYFLNESFNDFFLEIRNNIDSTIDKIKRAASSNYDESSEAFQNYFTSLIDSIKTSKHAALLNLPATILKEYLIPVTDESLNDFDLHKPYIDNLYFYFEDKGSVNDRRLYVREPDLIDVWFDSGSMPFAQMHFPFENVKEFSKNYPADFIAEGVDQTRGWFFTLHAISAMLKEEVQAELKKHGIEADDKKYPGIAFKNVISNGLVLDKHGNKMSKSKGNTVDPFITLEKYGADATRWYMIANAAPWDNLKFNAEGIADVQRQLFGTLYNTYGFYSLYANVDNFLIDEKNSVPINERQELDRWILSKLNNLIKDVTEQYENFEPHRAARSIETFVDEHFSNWYIRLSRRRFWKGEMSTDKQAAYETLHECLLVVSQLMSPIAPFFGEWLYQNLSLPVRENAIKNKTALQFESVHLSEFIKTDTKLINIELEQQMELAQKISSMILSIRKKENLRVRQPLQKIQIPILDKTIQAQIDAVKDLILAEVNVKEIEFVDESQTNIVKNLKLNFKTLGKKCGTNMKAVQAFALENGAKIIHEIELTGKYILTISGTEIVLENEDVEIIPVDIPGWKVANSGAITVALDITISTELKQEGLAREIVNRIQNIRKDKGFDVTDKILVRIQQNNNLDSAIKNNLSYICSETLTGDLQLVDAKSIVNASLVEVDETISTLISIEKLN